LPIIASYVRREVRPDVGARGAEPDEEGLVLLNGLPDEAHGVSVDLIVERLHPLRREGAVVLDALLAVRT
jgi:hypothetical protein